MKKRVLILCRGNSCRSQMAEGLWNALGDGKWLAFSAGSSPSGFVHPLAIEVMREVGIDISANRSKHIGEFARESFDLVVTVRENGKEACPSTKQTEHWPFDRRARPAKSTIRLWLSPSAHRNHDPDLYEPSNRNQAPSCTYSKPNRIESSALASSLPR